jgi:hypothetical protein
VAGIVAWLNCGQPARGAPASARGGVPVLIASQTERPFPIRQRAPEQYSNINENLAILSR